MSITGTPCHRRGISTILGTLIFVGIVFTSFIPMMMLMSQADMLYDLNKHELQIFDQEREDEDVYVYVFPVTENSPNLILKVHNRGNLVVNVVQVWINDNPYDSENFVLQPMSSDEIILNEVYEFNPVIGNSYLIKINTDRGNSFSSDSGALHYGSGGVWEGGMFALNFLISYPESGWYDIQILKGGNPLDNTPFQIHKSASIPAFAFFQVPSEGTYHIIITKNSNIIFDSDVIIYWPGSPVEWVFV